MELAHAAHTAAQAAAAEKVPSCPAAAADIASSSGLQPPASSFAAPGPQQGPGCCADAQQGNAVGRQAASAAGRSALQCYSPGGRGDIANLVRKASGEAAAHRRTRSSESALPTSPMAQKQLTQWHTDSAALSSYGKPPVAPVRASSFSQGSLEIASSGELSPRTPAQTTPLHPPRGVPAGTERAASGSTPPDAGGTAAAARIERTVSAPMTAQLQAVEPRRFFAYGPKGFALPGSSTAVHAEELERRSSSGSGGASPAATPKRRLFFSFSSKSKEAAAAAALDAPAPDAQKWAVDPRFAPGQEGTPATPTAPPTPTRAKR